MPNLEDSIREQILRTYRVGLARGLGGGKDPLDVDADDLNFRVAAILSLVKGERERMNKLNKEVQMNLLGKSVLYKLNQNDADDINRRRATSTAPRSESWPEGAQAHVGNKVFAGHVYPAFVVANFSEGVVNLQVLLDGNDSYWATSRHEGSDEGQWSA